MGLWVQGGGAQTAPSAGNAGDRRAAEKDEVTPTACCPSGGRQTPREGGGPRFVKDPQVTAVCTKHKKKKKKHIQKGKNNSHFRVFLQFSLPRAGRQVASPHYQLGKASTSASKHRASESAAEQASQNESPGLLHTDSKSQGTNFSEQFAPTDNHSQEPGDSWVFPLQPAVHRWHPASCVCTAIILFPPFPPFQEGSKRLLPWP